MSTPARRGVDFIVQKDNSLIHTFNPIVHFLSVTFQ